MTPKTPNLAVSDASTVETVSDKTPNRQEFAEQVKGVQVAIEDALNQALHDEVTRTGIKLDTTRQIDLPNKTRGANAGKTTLSGEGKAASGTSGVAIGDGKFTLLVGEFASKQEAKDISDAMETLGFKPILRERDAKAGSKFKGKFYRVYLGGCVKRRSRKSWRTLQIAAYHRGV